MELKYLTSKLISYLHRLILEVLFLTKIHIKSVSLTYYEPSSLTYLICQIK